MADYEPDKAFLTVMFEGLPPEWARASGLGGLPMSVRELFELIEREQPRLVRQGIDELMGMVIEGTSHWPVDTIRSLDEQLAAMGATTLAAVRLRYSRKIALIERRGVIRTEEEAYLVKNLLDGLTDQIPAERLERLQAMFDAFEQTITSGS